MKYNKPFSKPEKILEDKKAENFYEFDLLPRSVPQSKENFVIKALEDPNFVHSKNDDLNTYETAFRRYFLKCRRRKKKKTIGKINLRMSHISSECSKKQGLKSLR